MTGRLPFCFLLALGISFLLPAQQNDLYGDQLEMLLYQHEDQAIPEELFEYLEENSLLLLDLNHATQEQLEDSRLLTPFQVHQLISYRKRFGDLYSLLELAALPGFNSYDLSKLESLVVLRQGSDIPGVKQNRHWVMMDVGRKYPTSMGYRQEPGQEEKAYAGSPLYTTLRVRSQTGNHLSMGLTYEKDAGEKLFLHGLPQFLSGYLNYKGQGFLKQLLAGTFQLNQGQGLVNGTGFYHHPSSFKANHRTLSLLRPYASKSEQRFNRGLACQLAYKKLQVLLWGSHTLQDLSPTSLGEDLEGIAWWEYQRSTGLHRSQGELQGRRLAAKTSGGIQLLYHHRNFALGIMTGTERWSLTQRGSEILSKAYDPVNLPTASLHGTWQSERWQLCGELAAGTSSFALQMGTRVHFNDFLQGTVLIHHYGKEYRGSLPSSYASGAGVENEQGVAVHLHLEPGAALMADVTGEVFHYPSPRYRTLVPSHAFRINLTLHNPLNESFQWRIRLAGKAWQNTPRVEITGVRPLKESRLTRVDLRLIYVNSTQLSWQSRCFFSFLSAIPKPLPAFAVLQQVKFQASSRLQGSVQFVLFRVDDWDNRIYLHEPGFYYSFSFPCYYGRGQKSTLLLTWKNLKGITLSVKISGIRYYDRMETGSGPDRVEGNRLWESALQLRLKF